jgi:hypothetical protein
MKPGRFLLLLCLFVIFSMSLYGQKAGAVPANWQRVELGVFSISVPPSWSAGAAKGIDSYSGYFLGDDIVLRFERAPDSAPKEKYVSSKYMISYETVGGKNAQIVFPKTGEGLTAIYFPNIYAADLYELHYSFAMMTSQQLNRAQRDIALTVFRSIKLSPKKN